MREKERARKGKKIWHSFPCAWHRFALESHSPLFAWNTPKNCTCSAGHWVEAPGFQTYSDHCVVSAWYLRTTRGTRISVEGGDDLRYPREVAILQVSLRGMGSGQMSVCPYSEVWSLIIYTWRKVLEVCWITSYDLLVNNFNYLYFEIWNGPIYKTIMA